jgi:hypothetical protein
MVPGEEANGFVSPNILRPVFTTSLPSNTYEIKIEKCVTTVK